MVNDKNKGSLTRIAIKLGSRLVSIMISDNSIPCPSYHCYSLSQPAAESIPVLQVNENKTNIVSIGEKLWAEDKSRRVHDR